MQRMSLHLWAAIITIGWLLLVNVPSHCPAAEPQPNFKKWDKAIAAFEAADRKTAFPKAGLLFVGSSSIRLWDLPKYFPKQKPLNRGYGGSEIADSVHFAEQLILKHAPTTIVLYAGDNDIAHGKNAQRVAEDFQQFVKTIQHKLPDADIYYVCIKPSIRRWKLAEIMQQANEKIHSQCQKSQQLHYVDIWKPMLDKKGQPRAELFRKDGLHLNEQGYQLWTAVLKKSMQRAKNN